MKGIFWKIGLSILLVLALMVFHSAWAGEQLWDFENQIQEDDWEVINGTWAINDGLYQETSAAESAMHSLAGDGNWENYTLEGKVRVDEGNYAGLIFRALNEFEYYVFYVELVPEPRNLCFFRHIQGDFSSRERPNPNKTSIAAEDLARAEWLTMKIVVEGNQFTCFINDKEICVGNDNLGNEYRNGKVGVWAWQTKASFDDLKVYGPDIEGAAVDWRGKLAITWGCLKQH